MKKLLFHRESACIQPIRELIERQNHRTLVLWTVDCAGRVLEVLEKKYPQETRPRQAVEAAKAWSHGDIKMPAAKAAALAAHKAASEIANDPAACAAARAMGHVVGTVHVETHALGFVFYALTAFVYDAGSGNDKELIVADACGWFYERLLYWQANTETVQKKWAAFLLRDVPNKEKQLRQKREQNNRKIHRDSEEQL